MHAVVFDLDGTILQSAAVDDRLYRDAVRHVLGDVRIRPDSSDHHAIAIATGGWRESAQLKLDAAGLNRFGIPLATSDDAPDRKEIMRIVLGHLGSGFDSITYYGDGQWDRIASQALG